MRLDRIRIEGFLGHVDSKVDLRAVHTAVITGPVGAGKSSIIDAVTWCLYGEARGRTLDQLIHEGSDRATVTVIVAVGDARYQVTRTRRRGQDSSLLVERDEGPGWLTITSHTNAETEADLAARLGVEYQPLLAGPFMLQADTGALMRVSASARKQLLLDLMVGGAWERWSAKAKNVASECSMLVQGIDEQLRPLSDVAVRLDRVRRELVEAQADEAQADKDERAAIEAAGDVMGRMAVLREQASEAARLTKESGEVFARFLKAKATVDDLQHKMAVARVRYGDALEERPPTPDQGIDGVRALRADAMTAASDTSRELYRLETMAHITCPECGLDVMCPRGHTLSGPPLSDIDAARERYREAKLALESIDADEQRIRSETTKYEVWQRQVSDLAVVVPNLDVQAEAAKPLVVELAERGKAIRDRLAELGGSGDLEAIEREVRAVDAALANARAIHKDAGERRAYLSAGVLALEADENRARSLNEQRLETDTRGDIAAVLTRAFSRDGVPTLMLESTLPVMEARANEVLARMPGGMRLQLRTQRETQKATLRETLDVVIVMDGVERDYELLSGGQRFRVDLALRLGLTQVLSRRRIGTLIVDEGFDRWQDPEGRAAVLDTLTAVSQDFERVLVVSHHPDVIERFGTRIEVTMEEGVSHVG